MAIQFVPLNSHLLQVLWTSRSPDILISLTQHKILLEKKNSMQSVKYNQVYRHALLSEDLVQISDKRLWCGNNQIWTNLIPVKGSTDGKICFTISSRCCLIICIWNLTVMCYMAWKKISKISFKSKGLQTAESTIQPSSRQGWLKHAPVQDCTR